MDPYQPIAASTLYVKETDCMKRLRYTVGVFLLGSCAPHTAVIYGFPPYAWKTCSAWMHDYEANSKLIQANPGTLAIGKPIYSEVNGDRAYFVYPVTFTDRQKGKKVVYKGTWAMTLLRMQKSWVLAGSGSNWG
jgi:hypothetical protein